MDFCVTRALPTYFEVLVVLEGSGDVFLGASGVVSLAVSVLRSARGILGSRVVGTSGTGVSVGLSTRVSLPGGEACRGLSSPSRRFP